MLIQFSMFMPQRNKENIQGAKLTSGFTAFQLSLAGSLQLFFGIIFPSACLSQTYASSSVPINPGFNHGASNFSPFQGINCPTTTFNVTAFGANTNAWGDQHYAPYQSSTGSFGNYGGAVGLSIPMGSTAKDFCNKFAKSKLSEQELLLKNQIMNRQSTLLRNCMILRNQIGINLSANRPEFSENGPLSAFAECRSLAQLLEPENLDPDIKLKPVKLEPASIPEQQKAIPSYNINNPY